MYKDFTIWLTKTKDELNRIDIVFKYNYRFLNGDNVFVNIMEHIHVLEVDKDYRASLLLGNVITTENNQLLPIRSVMEVYRKGEMVETLYAKTYGSAISKYNITKRERDILSNLAAGKTSKQIGEQLFISHNTVDTHRRNLLKKLGCTSVVELAKIAYQNGLL